MAPRRLSDRYDVSGARLWPERDEDEAVVTAVRKLVPRGTVFHLLQCWPDQGEDGYVVLVDEHTIVSFELLRSDPATDPTEARVWRFSDYRKQIGQGRDRMRLDRVAELAAAALDLERR